jgi:hypothetical protein
LPLDALAARWPIIFLGHDKKEARGRTHTRMHLVVFGVITAVFVTTFGLGADCPKSLKCRASNGYT